MTSVPVREPSLSSRAMLCSLSISIWSARKHDAEAIEKAIAFVELCAEPVTVIHAECIALDGTQPHSDRGE